MAKKHNYVYDYPENREVNKLLKVGDRVDIAEALGFDADYVRMVLRGVRNNEEIISMAKKIIEDREKRIKGL